VREEEQDLPWAVKAGMSFAKLDISGFFKFWGRGVLVVLMKKVIWNVFCESLRDILAKPALTAVLPHEEDWIIMISYCLYR